MAHPLQGLIDQAQASDFSHVVVGLDPEGIRWRPQTESACQSLANILGEGWKVLTKEEFISGLQKVVDEDEKEGSK
jgi:hypothetical protein